MKTASTAETAACDQMKPASVVHSRPPRASTCPEALAPSHRCVQGRNLWPSLMRKKARTSASAAVTTSDPRLTTPLITPLTTVVVIWPAFCCTRSIARSTTVSTSDDCRSDPSRSDSCSCSSEV